MSAMPGKKCVAKKRQIDCALVPGCVAMIEVTDAAAVSAANTGFIFAILVQMESVFGCVAMIELRVAVFSAS